MVAPAHFLDRMIEDSDKLIKQIKLKYKNKSLARQLIVGARETADYSSTKERWSPEWYIQYLIALENAIK
jgi:hypothetical protein